VRCYLYRWKVERKPGESGMPNVRRPPRFRPKFCMLLTRLVRKVGRASSMVLRLHITSTTLPGRGVLIRSAQRRGRGRACDRRASAWGAAVAQRADAGRLGAQDYDVTMLEVGYEDGCAHDRTVHLPLLSPAVVHAGPVVMVPDLAQSCHGRRTLCPARTGLAG
jgi:hypothetical protein